MMTLRRHSDVLLNDLIQCRTFWSRLVGLLGHSSLGSDSAMWIMRTNAIHTFFMKFTIDVVFLDKSMRVQKVVTNVRPWRMVGPVLRADSVMEFPAGRTEELGIREGDQLHVGD